MQALSSQRTNELCALSRQVWKACRQLAEKRTGAVAYELDEVAAGVLPVLLVTME